MSDIEGDYNSCQQDSMCSADALSYMNTGVKGHMRKQRGVFLENLENRREFLTELKLCNQNKI